MCIPKDEKKRTFKIFSYWQSDAEFYVLHCEKLMFVKRRKMTALQHNSTNFAICKSNLIVRRNVKSNCYENKLHNKTTCGKTRRIGLRINEVLNDY